MSIVAAEREYVDHAEPWTEREYLALGETQQRVELIDGSLLMTPAPNGGHQRISRKLANLLDDAVPDDAEIFEAVNVRLAEDRILIPDIVVTRECADLFSYRPEKIILVAELVSPSTKAQDRVFKPRLYAAAGIPWYLLVELEDDDRVELGLHRRSGDTYVEQQRAGVGEQLHVEEPEAVIDVKALLRRR